MHIVMFSINPIFPDVVTGGASKHLYHVAAYLGKVGHQVEILCARPEEKQRAFTWAENVRVFPDLPFKQPFPQPYAVHGGDLALIVARVSRHLTDADRFYIHDGEFLIPDVYGTVPTVASFRDNIYPESVMGTFIGKFDEAICVSDFSADVICHTAGRFFPDLVNRLNVVTNGIDIDVFKPVDSRGLTRELGVDPSHETILLHPHRPEPGKGLPETIKVVYQLVNEYGFTNIKVIVPEWIDTMVSRDESSFYRAMMSLMRDLDIRDHFVFIPWLSQSRMPTLYSLGAVTLCLGGIVEAFGNVAYESLACGTPSVVARVGVHRTMLPDELMTKVNYGDIKAAAAAVAEILQGGGVSHDRVMDTLKKKMDFSRQVRSYAEIITRCEKRSPLTYDYRPPSAFRKFRLAPWCMADGDRIYHDFEGTYDWLPDLAALARTWETFSRDTALKADVSEETWAEWINRTYIVPVVKKRGKDDYV